jgi:putative membrane protein
MMYWANGDWNWAAWITMTASMILFWGLVAWVVVTLVRRPEETARTADDILADRLARGEIDDDEYHRRSDALRSPR